MALRPLEALSGVTLRQDVTQLCFDVDPNSVRAGADRDITVTAELENNIDEDRDHTWRIEIDGEGIGFTTTTVPAGETVRPEQTRTIPEELLPVDGGSVDVAIQQIGGQEQRSECGILEVLAAEEEPTIDPRLVGFDGCSTPERTVEEDEVFDLTVTLTNDNELDVDVDVAWTVDGDPILQLPGQTLPADTVEFTISAETTAELAFIAPGQTVDVFVEVTNPDVGIDISGFCGSITVAGAFDEDAVFVPPGDCTVSPQQVSPPQDVDLQATVVNDNALAATAEVAWVWLGTQIATAEATLDAESQATVSATATIQREGQGQVTAEVARASGGVSSAPAETAPAPDWSYV